MKTPRDPLDDLPKDDPNSDIAKRVHLAGWADSHALVADTLAGKVSLSEWVERCVNSFRLGADGIVAFRNIPLAERCRTLDQLTTRYIRRFRKIVSRHSKRFGKANVKAATDHLSRSLKEISARSKQQLFAGALAQELGRPTSPTEVSIPGARSPVPANQEVPFPDHPGAEKAAAEGGQMPTIKRKPRARPRRTQRYLVIDKALEAIAQSRPRTQKEVFLSLENRHVVFPAAEPFLSGRGWMAGFRRDPERARAWLSKRWRELDLPALPRGPKRSTPTE